MAVAWGSYWLKLITGDLKWPLCIDRSQIIRVSCRKHQGVNMNRKMKSLSRIHLRLSRWLSTRKQQIAMTVQWDCWQWLTLISEGFTICQCGVLHPHVSAAFLFIGMCIFLRGKPKRKAFFSTLVFNCLVHGSFTHVTGSVAGVTQGSRIFFYPFTLAARILSEFFQRWTPFAGKYALAIHFIFCICSFLWCLLTADIFCSLQMFCVVSYRPNPG